MCHPDRSDLTIGQAATLTAVAKDSRGTVLPNRPASWAFGAPLVATVSANGVVTAVGSGSAVIFATIEGKTGSALVNVRQIPVTSVTVAPSSSNLAVGAFVVLVPTVRSGTTVLTDRVVGWTSSNESIAPVSSTGRVTGLRAGTVTITATVEGVTGTAFVAVGIASVVVTPNPTSVVSGQTTAAHRGCAGRVERDGSGRAVSVVNRQRDDRHRRRDRARDGSHDGTDERASDHHGRSRDRVWRSPR